MTDYNEARLKPAKVELGRMPESATIDMRRVAQDVRLLIGLRLAVGEDEPLPYATSLAAERMGWGADRRRASRALQKLCNAGVIRHAGTLPPRSGRQHGTKLYESPLLAGAGAIEGESVEVEPVVPFEPELEMADDSLVDDAVLAERGHLGVTSGDGADEGISHKMDATATVGRDPDVERAERIAARHGDLCA